MKCRSNKVGWEVSHVWHDAAALEFGAETHARVSRKDEDQRRPQGSGTPSGQGTAQADRLTWRSVTSPRSARSQYLLRNSAAIRLVLKEGRRVSCPLFTLLYPRNALDRTRLGGVGGKKLGGAVWRNRSKRRFRELAPPSLPRLPPGPDLLILPRRQSATPPAQNLRETWHVLLAPAKLLVPGDTQ